MMLATLFISLADTLPDPSAGENPTPTQWVVIVVIVAVIPAALLAARLVGRVTDDRKRIVIAVAAVGVSLVCDFLNGPTSHWHTNIATTLAFVSLVLTFNGLGIGAVIGWAIRLTERRLASVGGLITRALPVVLLTVLVFFNGAVWSMAASITAQRLWALITFLILIAVAFLVTGIVDRARPLLNDGTVDESDVADLAGTPFEAMSDPDVEYPLDTAERANVVFVMVASAVAQIATVAMVTGMIFLVIGLIALTPEVVADWSHHGPERGMWFGITLPVPTALVHVSLFLGGLTFMYVSARAIGEKEYRAQFLDPLIDDLHLTLVARNRYRHYLATGGT